MAIPITVQPPTPPAIVVPAEAYASGRVVSFGLPVAHDILDDAHEKGIAISGEPKEAAFVADAERNLWRAFGAITARLDAAQANHAYRDMFTLLVELEPAVSAFFDKGGVMVMDPDEALRENRLSLLDRILQPFMKVADFRLASQQGAA